jgi:hypothetical protein
MERVQFAITSLFYMYNKKKYKWSVSKNLFILSFKNEIVTIFLRHIVDFGLYNFSTWSSHPTVYNVSPITCYKTFIIFQR